MKNLGYAKDDHTVNSKDSMRMIGFRNAWDLATDSHETRRSKGLTQALSLT
jgi:hypothetical protein